jgi:hypothetical protein
MTKKRFWDIIAASRSEFDREDVYGSRARQVSRLHDLLSALSIEEVQAFAQFFADRLDEAYSKPQHIVDGEPQDGLWAVAFNIGGGCSDDMFHDFRNWLISMGKVAYEAALADPETVYDVASENGLEEDVFFEEFEYVASRVWREKTGQEG